jgi:hypothetical protein
LPTDIRLISADLATIIERWESLPEGVKAEVLALVKAHPFSPPIRRVSEVSDVMSQTITDARLIVSDFHVKSSGQSDVSDKTPIQGHSLSSQTHRVSDVSDETPGRSPPSDPPAHRGIDVIGRNPPRKGKRR